MSDLCTPVLARGWNTWWTRSLLAHVHLPDGLCVNLSVKHYGEHTLTEALVFPEALKRPELIPGLRTWDETYTSLELRWNGVRLTVQTAIDEDDLLLLVTPLASPAKRPCLIADMGFLWNRPGTTWRDGEVLRSSEPERVLHACGPLVEEPDTPLRGPALAQVLSDPVALCTGRARSLEEVQALIASRRPGTDAPQSLRTIMRNTLAWNTIYDPSKDRVVTPVSRVWNTGWGGCVLFCWDTYFAAWMAAADGQQELAWANAIEMTAEITPEGFVPNFAGANGAKSWDRSQPPVGALTCRYLVQQFGDTAPVAKVFDDLLRWNRWWPEHRETNGLLCWGSDTEPVDRLIGFRHEGNGVHERLGAALESGLDNSPLYDDIPFDAERHQLVLADVGLNALYVADCQALADLARVLNRPEADELTGRAERFAQAVQEQLWSEQHGLYLNRRLDTGTFSERLAPTLFYPMLAGIPTEAQADRMVREHLQNPEEFAGTWILPSIARNDPAYADNDYWRGRIWAPMNFLVYLGLCHYNQPEARRELADKSAALIRKEWASHGHVHENYNAETGEGCDVPSSDPFYHWGGLLALIPLLEAERTR